jgi:hypothetical protein
MSEYPSMTKVLMNANLLTYQRGMVDALRQIIQHNYITGAPQPYLAYPPFTQERLLAPPSIGFISLDGYLGQGDDYIVLVASHDFGMHSMHITILDDGGHVIETGAMWPFPGDPNGWEYVPTVQVPPGTSVTVHITAIDCMGGIGRGWEKKTMGDDER